MPVASPATRTAQSGTLPSPFAVLELLKPITWFPPMWAFGCGAVSANGTLADKWWVLLLGVVLVGPLVCAASQAANDWFDRHVDAINEPQRPIPSGRMPGRWGLYVAIGWTLLSLLLAVWLGPLVLGACAIGLVFAWAYSAPPVRLKQNGWLGNAAVAVCYEGLPWLTGAMVSLGGSAPEWRVWVLAGLYSLGAHGIMTLNDFKSIEGDRRMGIASLPASLGVDRAAWVACAVMAVPQTVVGMLLAAWDAPMHALAVGLLLATQLLLMRRFLFDPVRFATWYSALGINFYVSGMLIAAFALRGS